MLKRNVARASSNEVALHWFDRELLLVRRVGYLQVVGHLEDARHAVGANAGYIFVCLAQDHAIQGDVAIHDRDADRLRRIDGVFIAGWDTRK